LSKILISEVCIKALALRINRYTSSSQFQKGLVTADTENYVEFSSLIKKHQIAKKKHYCNMKCKNTRFRGNILGVPPLHWNRKCIDKSHLQHLTATNTIDSFCKECFSTNQTSQIRSRDRLLTEKTHIRAEKLVY